MLGLWEETGTNSDLEMYSTEHLAAIDDTLSCGSCSLSYSFVINKLPYIQIQFPPSGCCGFTAVNASPESQESCVVDLTNHMTAVNVPLPAASG